MRARLLIPVFGLVLLPSTLLAQNPLSEERYLAPPKEIADLVLAPRHENYSLTNLGPDRTRFLVGVSAGMPTIAQMSKPYLNLAGVQIDPKANRARTLGYRSSLGYRIVDARSGKTSTVEAPSGARVTAGDWSPDGKQIAFFAHFEDGSYLYVADASTGRSRRLTRAPLLLTLTSGLQWADQGRRIFATFVPDNRPPEPKITPEPNQPMVRLTEAVRNRTRTYQGLLTDTRSQGQLEYLTTSQLAWVNVSDGRLHKVGQPAMIRSFDVSPDGRYVRVVTMLKPFSYFVPASSFGRMEEIWDESGKVLAEIEKRELRAPQSDDDAEPQGAQRPDAKRNLTWHPSGQGLSYLQQAAPPARDPGDGSDEQRRGGGQATATAAQAARPDRVYHWLPPFGPNDAKQLYQNDVRINSLVYSPDGQTLFMTETRAGQQHLFAVRLAEPTSKETIVRYRSDDFYRNPGSLLTTTNSLGLSVARLSEDGRSVYLSGTQYFEKPDEQAPRPFLERAPIGGGDRTRLWQSSDQMYEDLSTVLDEQGASSIVISRQSRTMPTNFYRLELASKQETPLTSNRDLTPQITAAQRYRVRVTRPDGFQFWVRVTTPPDHVKGRKLPAMFWFYPREFENQQAYDRAQRSYNKNSYPSTGAMTIEYLTVLGYAVIQPDAPIVAPTARRNDPYVHDLRNNLAATIDALEAEGIIDRSKLAVGGHSYGAFSSANAMVHTPFFKAGIAGHGNYNRTLTPMAFQSETRILWEARETYLAMSPILYADQLTGALLMYHGTDDQNVGTDPINSIRMFHALLGLGKPAALYLYPYEDHGPAARETLLDMWARWVAWLDQYVKGNKP